jgi:hypothetical protein
MKHGDFMSLRIARPVTVQPSQAEAEKKKQKVFTAVA